MKPCPYPDCDEEIMDWSQYCYIHKQQIKDEEKLKMENKEQEYPRPPMQNTYGNPTIDRDVVRQSYQDKTYGQTNPVSQPPPVRNIITKQRFEKPELGDRDRLIVKQVCLKEAVSVLNGMDAFNQLEYNDVLDKLRRITVDLYNIVIEKNEG